MKTKKTKMAVPFKVQKMDEPDMGGMDEPDMGGEIPVIMPKNMPTKVKGNNPGIMMKGQRKHMGW